VSLVKLEDELTLELLELTELLDELNELLLLDVELLDSELELKLNELELLDELLLELAAHVQSPDVNVKLSNSAYAQGLLV
jgi:hypothetical protein